LAYFDGIQHAASGRPVAILGFREIEIRERVGRHYSRWPVSTAYSTFGCQAAVDITV
jgi:hypothetical protein